MGKRYHYLTPEDYVTAERNGINKETLKSRVRKYGWDVDCAITKPVRKPVNNIQKWVPLALKNGIRESTLRSRFELGWDPLIAATKPIIKGRERCV